MKKPSTADDDLEHAKAYVKEMDYIFDENREIAGKAFLAGLQAGRAQKQDEVEKLKQEVEDLQNELLELGEFD